MTFFGIVPKPHRKGIIIVLAFSLVAWTWPPGHNMENKKIIGYDSAQFDGQEALGKLYEDGTVVLFLNNGTGWRPVVLVRNLYLNQCPPIWKDYHVLDKTRRHPLPVEQWRKAQWKQEFSDRQQCRKRQSKKEVRNYARTYGHL